jgi:hypothetical protein
MVYVRFTAKKRRIEVDCVYVVSCREEPLAVAVVNLEDVD